MNEMEGGEARKDSLGPSACVEYISDSRSLGRYVNRNRTYELNRMSQAVNYADSPSRAIARGQLAEYDRVLADHAEAEDCGRCETYMELGIQVLQWILRADQDYRRELYKNPSVHSEVAEKELESLVRGWLAHGQGLVGWAERNAKRGFQVRHLEEFRRSFDEATAIVASLNETDADRVMPEPLIVLRDQALVEHRNGETSEFV